MKILVTGFDPFGGEKINPAIESVKLLPDSINGHEIVKLEINTVAYKSLEQIKSAIIKENPDVVLSIGQSGGRTDITLEKVGINLNDFSITDNEGNQIIDEKIFEDGENAYFATIPIKSIVERIKENKIPASISYTAGTFVCNHVLYGVCYMSAKEFKNIKSGFIHIPFLPEQVVDKPKVASMSLETIVKALKIAIEVICENVEDVKSVAGTTH